MSDIRTFKNAFIVGAGRLGCGLAKVLPRVGIEVSGIWSRTRASSERAERITGLPASYGMKFPPEIFEADIVFLAVADDAVANTCESIAGEGLFGQKKLVIHCSGCLDLSVLDSALKAGALTGSMHPLQSFSDHESSSELFSGAYTLIEGSEHVIERLKLLASALGMKVLGFDNVKAGKSSIEERRVLYHAAAVTASSGVLSAFDLALEIACCAGLSRMDALEGLLVLTKTSFSNLEKKGSVADAMTGPVSRGDYGIIQKHLKALEKTGQDKIGLYSSLSKRAHSIIIPDEERQLGRTGNKDLKIALFGGSFNPPHLGHVYVIAHVLATEDIDEIWLMPTYSHAFGKKMAQYELRLKMCSSIADLFGNSVKTSRVEEELVEENERNYTVDTLRYLVKRYPEASFSMIIGSDNLSSLDNWKEASELRSLCGFIVIDRSGHSDQESQFSIPDISSSIIRERLKSGLDINHLVPRQVAKICMNESFYIDSGKETE